ncbi:MAG: ComF family protein [Bryobacteraceae bacterium]
MCPGCLRKPTALIAEYFCRDCRTPFRNRFPLDEDGRCALCRLGLNGFDAAYSFGAFEAELRELIHVFKYGRVETLAGPLGRLLALALPRAERFDAVVPMPLHWVRRWTRGFNQSELLAREIARRCSVPVRNLVRRARATTPQAGLTNAKRRANVSGAFRVPRPERVRGLRILLVDDVMTTGATASACARALKQAGAARVALLTVARVDRRMNSDAGRLSVLEPERDHVGSLEGHARA